MMRRVVLDSRDIAGSVSSSESSSQEIPEEFTVDHSARISSRKLHDVDKKPVYPSHPSFVVDMENEPLYEYKVKKNRKNEYSRSQSHVFSPDQQPQQRVEDKSSVKHGPPSQSSSRPSPVLTPRSPPRSGGSNVYYPPKSPYGRLRRKQHQREKRSRLFGCQCCPRLVSSRNIKMFCGFFALVLVCLVLYAALFGQVVEMRDAIGEIRETVASVIERMDAGQSKT